MYQPRWAAPVQSSHAKTGKRVGSNTRRALSSSAGTPVKDLPAAGGNGTTGVTAAPTPPPLPPGSPTGVSDLDLDDASLGAHSAPHCNDGVSDLLLDDTSLGAHSVPPCDDGGGGAASPLGRSSSSVLDSSHALVEVAVLRTQLEHARERQHEAELARRAEVSGGSNKKPKSSSAVIPIRER